MTAKMKALVKSRPEPGLWLEEVPIPEIGINDVLVKIHKTAICGTDIHIYNWNEWAQKTIPVPMTVGHEFVGRVEEVNATGEGLAGKREISRKRRERSRPEPRAGSECGCSRLELASTVWWPRSVPVVRYPRTRR